MEFKLPRWEELPQIDLYLEQVIDFISQWIGDTVGDENGKVLTRTMVNNYVKQKIISAPVKKKYDKQAIAFLFVIAVLKNICTMEEIRRLIDLALEASHVERSYNSFCDVVEDVVKKTFDGSAISARDDLSEVQYILHNVGRAFASQLYVKKMYFSVNELSEDTVKTIAPADI